MSALLRKPSGPPGGAASVVVHPADGQCPGWSHVGFEAFRFPAGFRHIFRTVDREACLVAIGGRCGVRSNVGEWEIGERADPFTGRPHALYLPPGAEGEIRVTAAVDVAIGYARATSAPPARGLPPGGARVEVRGSGAMERTIHHILMEDQAATSLLVTEVVTPAGHWSSYPPHKHDTDDPPRERALEEIYYIRFRDERGFGLMRVYTTDGALDETIPVHDGDLVLVPRGYHTFSAAPGYEAYYLNVMAGAVREWRITFDPDHERMRW